ncbi:MAG: HAD family hydrolase [Christensenellales bacterium]
MRNLIIFDCFGVVLGEIAPVWFAARFGVEKGEKLKEKYFAGGDSGEKNIEQIIEEIQADLGISRSTIVAEWNNLLEVNDRILKLVVRLRKNNAVAMLTNAPAGLFEKLFEKPFTLFDYFDKVFISGDMKIAKPVLEAYKRCINAFEEEFNRIYMIDDNSKNLFGLERLNIVPVLYKDDDDLEDFCRRIEQL